MPSRLKRSSAQNSTQSNLRRLAASNQAGKLLALARALAAAHAVNILAHEVVARTGTPRAQVAELVLRVLAFVLSRHPRIDRNAHDYLAGVAGTVSLRRTHRKQSFSA